MELNEEKIRAYLLRQIANKNKTIVGMMSNEARSYRNGFNNGFNEILSAFSGGLNTGTMERVFDHIAENPKKSYSAYNYFDIDTLIAYNSYLENIIICVDGVAAGYRHMKPTANDFRTGFKTAKEEFRKYAGKEGSGYYNTSKPVTLAYTYRNGYKVLDPKKPMSRDAFAKKYNEKDCQDEVNKYLSIRHNKESRTIGNHVHEYVYNGKKYLLDVVKKEQYTSDEGYGVTYIEARGAIGTLMGTYFQDGSVYEGDLYDLDGELVEMDGGGEVFYANKNFDEKNSYRLGDFEM